MSQHDTSMSPRQQRPERLAQKAAAVAFLAVGLMFDAEFAAGRQPVPVPRPRPPALERKPSSVPTGWTKVDQHQPPNTAAGADEGCLARLRALDVRFDRPTMPPAKNPACQIESPVRLNSVTARFGRGETIRLPDEPILSCEFAVRLSDWLGNLVAPLVAGRMSADLKAVHTGPGFECRNRNGLATGKLSEHALGKALDVASLELSNGKSIPMKPDGDDATRDLLGAIRTAACGWFTTVLGPGSDAFHSDHVHLDIIVHGGSDRYRICQ
jgi:hypothetical protein